MTRKPIKVTEHTYKYLDENSMGICLSCLYAQDGCEPDARGYNCEGCEDETGKRTKSVYGASELLISGEIVFVDSEEEETVKI